MSEKILIAEDDVTSRNILQAILKKHGHEVIIAQNGAEAMAIMEKKDRPNLLILDWLMPEIDGLEVCKRVRAMKTSENPYIIMLTIKGEKTDIVAGLDAGADDYLSKPYDPDELRARIGVGKRMISLQQALAARIETLYEFQTNIQRLLAEKELLLKEIHHRIKNNMNTIYGLLVLQAAALTEPSAIRALEDAGHRVKSMMTLYDKLYRSSDFTELSATKYLSPLISEIISNFPNSASVKLVLDINDFPLSVMKIQPLGILLNELLTNIMKYAFIGRNDGLISVRVSLSENRVILSVADNGNGMPESINFKNSTGFGLVLVGEMTKQLEGTIEIARENGTCITLEFDR